MNETYDSEPQPDLPNSSWFDLLRSTANKLTGLFNRIWRCNTPDMPKVDPAATRIQRFVIDNNFQDTFDAWAAEVEKKHDGKLEIVFQETLNDGIQLLVSWRIAPKKSIASPRRR
jgi:hypothetical protein